MLKVNWLPQGTPDLIWDAPAGDWGVWDHSGLEAATFTSWQHGPWGCHLHITPHTLELCPILGMPQFLQGGWRGALVKNRQLMWWGQLSSASHPPEPVSSARQTHGSAGGGGETLSSLQ